MSLRRQEGENDILYVSTSDPGSTSARKDSTNYEKFGLLSDLSDEVSNETQSTLDRASTQHESVIYGQQSSSVDATANVQKENDSNTTTEDPGQILVRDAAMDQDIVHYLIQPEDDGGTPVTGLEGEYGAFVVESISNTRNAGEFKQYEISGQGRKQPSFFTVA